MATVHRATPTLTALDPRALAVRSVAYCRMAASGPAEARISRSAHDAAGRAVAQWDPRLGADPTAPANLASVYSLTGTVLGSRSVDAGWRARPRCNQPHPLQCRGRGGRANRRQGPPAIVQPHPQRPVAPGATATGRPGPPRPLPANLRLRRQWQPTDPGAPRPAKPRPHPYCCATQQPLFT